MLFTTIAFSQTKTFGTQVKLKKTPNLATVDSLLTKDSNDIISATAFSDFKTQLGLGVYLQNIVEDVTPELGGNLDMNLFDITGIGSINHAGNITSTGTLEIPNINALNDLTVANNVTLTNYTNIRDDGTSLNYLFTDASGNLQSGPVSNIIYDVYSTSETVVGSWIDGKPIYRKVIVGDYPTTNWYDLSDIDTMVKLEWQMTDALEDITYQNPHTRLSGIQAGTPNSFIFNKKEIFFYNDGVTQGIQIVSKKQDANEDATALGESDVTVSFIIIFEYTKTTD